MSVSDERSRSTRSRTTRSLLLRSIRSPPQTFRARHPGGHEQEVTLSRAASAGLLRLCAAGCLWRRALFPGVLGGRYGLLHLLHDTPSLGGVDLDSGTHRACECDSANVPAFRSRGPRAHDLLEDRGVVLEQLPLAEAPLSK